MHALNPLAMFAFPQVRPNCRRCVHYGVCIALRLVLGGWCAASVAAAQEGSIPGGFSRLEGTYLEIVTDLPIDDDMRQLTRVFDAAMPIWCEQFDIPLEQVASWHATAYVMLDRERFEQAGFIPAELPDFKFGFQFKDGLWVVEQPSPYYRRHLLLHEGTHWFMQRKYGGAGPPWLMEGMAEWLGTHRWDGETLQMGIVPRDKLEVPYWGRITLIQQQLANGTAPSLESILRYGDTAHQRVDAYAWSWAAVLFLRSHPETRRMFERMFDQPMVKDQSLSRWLFARLKHRWPELRPAWHAFLTDLEYGYDPAHGMLQTENRKASAFAEPITIELDAARSWQSAGVRIDKPSLIKITASGRFQVGVEPSPWISEPAGVTLEYYRGLPLGCLLMTTAGPIDSEPERSQTLFLIPVGAGGEYRVEQPGELFFKINESVSGLSDNSGTITVTVAP